MACNDAGDTAGVTCSVSSRCTAWLRQAPLAVGMGRAWQGLGELRCIFLAGGAADAGVPSVGVDAADEVVEDVDPMFDIRPDGGDVCADDLPGGFAATKAAAGGLRRCLSWWVENAKSSHVRQWIEHGFPLWWRRDTGPPAACHKPNHPSCQEAAHRQFVSDSVRALHSAGAVGKVTDRPHCVSPLSVVPKKNGKLRLVLNLRHVNRHLVVPRFRYESLRDLGFLARPGDLMFSIDLQDGYWQLQMHPDAYTYLGFEWEGEYYVFKVLPFGLATAPWAFSKAMREVCDHLRSEGSRMLNYLDDFLFLAGRVASQALQWRERVLGVFRAAGLAVNVAKSQLQPGTGIEHLGYVFSSVSGELSIPTRRWEAFQAAVLAVVGKGRATARALQRVAGHVASMSLALGPVARLQVRALHACVHQAVSWQSWVPISDEAQAELRFWAACPQAAYVGQVWPRPVARVDLTLHTDASGHSWAGLGPMGLEARGSLTEEQCRLSSGYRELFAVHQVLISMQSALAGKSLMLYTDSQNCVSNIRHGSRVRLQQELAMAIFEWCRAQRVTLQVQWVPREANAHADALSKFEDWEDFCLSPEAFAEVERLWGPHTVDRFASHQACLLPVFNSQFWCPGTAGVDALAQEWVGENNWCHPPYGLVGLVIMHMLQQGASGSLMAPHWTKRPWWPLLEPVPGLWAPFVVGCLPVSSLRSALVPGLFSGRVPGGTSMVHWRGFVLRLDFSPGFHKRTCLPMHRWGA